VDKDTSSCVAGGYGIVVEKKSVGAGMSDAPALSTKATKAGANESRRNFHHN
jgi:hypothetical protein